MNSRPAGKKERGSPLARGVWGVGTHTLNEHSLGGWGGTTTLRKHAVGAPNSKEKAHTPRASTDANPKP